MKHNAFFVQILGRTIRYNSVDTQYKSRSIGEGERHGEQCCFDISKYLMSNLAKFSERLSGLADSSEGLQFLCSSMVTLQHFTKLTDSFVTHVKRSFWSSALRSYTRHSAQMIPLGLSLIVRSPLSANSPLRPQPLKLHCEAFETSRGSVLHALSLNALHGVPLYKDPNFLYAAGVFSVNRGQKKGSGRWGLHHLPRYHASHHALSWVTDCALVFPPTLLPTTFMGPPPSE